MAALVFRSVQFPDGLKKLGLEGWGESFHCGQESACGLRRAPYAVLPHRGKNKRRFMESASRERQLPEKKSKQAPVLRLLRELTLAARRMGDNVLTLTIGEPPALAGGGQQGRRPLGASAPAAKQ